MDTNHPDTQKHITQCDKLLENKNMLVSDKVDIEDIFSTDVTKQTAVSMLFEKLLEKRRKIEKQRKAQEKLSHDGGPSDPALV
jgi:hypothetical protein